MDTGDFLGFNVSVGDDGIAWIRFTTPERLNGMTASIKRDLVEIITQCQMDNAVRVVVFTGSGRAFCAGDDLKGYGNANIDGKALTPQSATVTTTTWEPTTAFERSRKRSIRQFET